MTGLGDRRTILFEDRLVEFTDDLEPVVPLLSQQRK